MTKRGTTQRRWTEPEKRLLAGWYAEHVDIIEIARRLARPIEGVRSKAAHMGLRRKAKGTWTEDEIAILKAEYDTCRHPRDLAEKLERPLASVFDKAYQLGLRRLERRDWTPEEDEIIRRGHAAGKTLIEIAEEVGRKYTTVAKRASKALGLAFNMGPRKKQPKLTAPARASAQDVAGDTPACCEPQTNPSGGAAARRMECLRIAAKFRKTEDGVLALAERIDHWAGRKDRALRLKALEIAASRHEEGSAVWREAGRFAEWAGAGGDPAGAGRVAGRRARAGIPDALDRLEALVAGCTGVSVPVIRGDSRIARFVRARHMLCYVAHNLAGASFSEIGRRLGGRDHTSIRHAVDLIEAIRPGPEVEIQLAAIAAEFGAELPPPISPGAGLTSGAKAGRTREPAAKPQPQPKAAPAQAAVPELKLRAKPAATVKPDPIPKAKPAPKPKPAAGTPAKRRPARQRAADVPLSEAEDKVLRTVIRGGITRTGALEPAVGLPIGPLTKVLQGLERKRYVEIRDGAIRVKRLPSGKSMPGLRQADATVRIVKPAPARSASRQTRRPAARPAPSTPAPRPSQARSMEDEPAMRRCLGCGEMFPSDGFGNRMCTGCKSRKVEDETWMGGSF